MADKLPLIPGEPIVDGIGDWEKAYEFVRDSRGVLQAQIERIETKSAAILAGTIALLAYYVPTIRKQYFDQVVVVLLLLPLVLLLWSLRAVAYKEVLNLIELKRTFAQYPRTFYRATVYAAADILEHNSKETRSKAWLVNAALILLIISTVLVVLQRAFQVTR